MSLLWPFIFMITACGATMVVYNNQYNIPKYSAHQYINQDLIPVSKDTLKRLKKAQVPTLTQEQCYRNEYCNCPRYQGSYEQCTNHYSHVPTQDQCPCNNRNFELCPWPFKILEGRYAKPIRPTADNFKTIPHHPKDELYMNVQEITTVPPKETGPFALPVANLRTF